MKKIITITGHKHTKKNDLARKLAKNSEVIWVQPYTDRPIPKSEIPEKYGEYHFTTKEELDYLIKNNDVLSVTTINNHRYVFFNFQITANYNVLIVDDYGVVDIKTRWKGKIYTIRVVSDNEEQSDRVGEFLYKHEFDTVFDVDKDDYDELEALIV